MHAALAVVGTKMVAGDFSFFSKPVIQLYLDLWASIGGGRGGHVPPTFYQGGDNISIPPPTFFIERKLRNTKRAALVQPGRDAPQIQE